MVKDFKKKNYQNPFFSAKTLHLPHFFIISALILITALAYLLIFASFWQIKIIKITGNYPVERESIYQQISQYLSAGLLPRTHYFFLGSKKIEKTLKEQYPLEQAEVRKNFKSRAVEIELTGKPFIGYWISQGLIFKIDKNGKVYNLAEKQGPKQADSAIQIYNLENNIPNLNDEVVGKQVLEFIDYFSRQTAKDYKIKFWEVSRSASQLNLASEDGWKFYFDQKSAPNDQFNTLERVLAYVITPTDHKRIDYIDLRFGERVYYKLK